MGVMPDPVRPAPREMAPVTAGSVAGGNSQVVVSSRRNGTAKSASGVATGAGHLMVCQDAEARRGRASPDLVSHPKRAPSCGAAFRLPIPGCSGTIPAGRRMLVAPAGRRGRSPKGGSGA